MPLRNAFENLSTESKQDALLAAVAGLDPLTDVQLRAAPPSVRDDYLFGEVLAEQSGANDVLTFTFSTPVQLVVVESKGVGLVSRANPFGATPSQSLGWPCRDEIPNYFPVITSSVLVYAPNGTTVNVIGYRR